MTKKRSGYLSVLAVGLMAVIAGVSSTHASDDWLSRMIDLEWRPIELQNQIIEKKAISSQIPVFLDALNLNDKSILPDLSKEMQELRSQSDAQAEALKKARARLAQAYSSQKADLQKSPDLVCSADEAALIRSSRDYAEAAKRVFAKPIQGPYEDLLRSLYRSSDDSETLQALRYAIAARAEYRLWVRYYDALKKAGLSLGGDPASDARRADEIRSMLSVQEKEVDELTQKARTRIQERTRFENLYFCTEIKK